MDVRAESERKLNTEELMVLVCSWRKTLESLLNCKVIQPVNPKGNQSCTFIRGTDGEGETPILWPPDAKILWPHNVKRQLIGKDFDVGKD